MSGRRWAGLGAEWASSQRSGYAAEPPQGSVRAQAGEWTLALQLRMGANMFGVRVGGGGLSWLGDLVSSRKKVIAGATS